MASFVFLMVFYPGCLAKSLCSEPVTYSLYLFILNCVFIYPAVGLAVASGIFNLVAASVPSQELNWAPYVGSTVKATGPPGKFLCFLNGQIH